jgi:hypothetical protein
MEQAGSGPLGNPDEEADNERNEKSDRDGPAEKKRMFPPIGFAHSGQKVITVRLGVFRFKKSKHARSFIVGN